jgi:ketosteroid isomerase-like protein
MKRVLFVCLISALPRLALSFDFYQETQNLLKNLNAGDSVSFFNHFKPEAQFHHLGENGIETLALQDFSPVLRKFKAGQYREDFTKVEVNDLETGLVYVDVYFTFYIDNQFSFAGVDHAIWIKSADTYKIVTLYSGALKPKFTSASGVSSISNSLNELMNKWHQDVATFQFEAYFDFMTSDFIFLGTDPTERWTKAEFEKFCQPHFEKKSTWDFKTNWRNWYMNEREDIAWFEESLDTWMEECRGTGVLKKENGAWKIAHYNLTVLIENDKTDKFIKLRKK